jgi:Cu+-exporting ATPase
MKKVKAFVRDPVCGMQVNPRQADATRVHMGKTFYFCSPGCAQESDANPHRYLEVAPQQAVG